MERSAKHGMMTTVISSRAANTSPTAKAAPHEMPPRILSILATLRDSARVLVATFDQFVESVSVADLRHEHNADAPDHVSGRAPSIQPLRVASAAALKICHISRVFGLLPRILSPIGRARRMNSLRSSGAR